MGFWKPETRSRVPLTPVCVKFADVVSLLDFALSLGCEVLGMWRRAEYARVGRYVETDVEHELPARKHEDYQDVKLGGSNCCI